MDGVCGEKGFLVAETGGGVRSPTRVGCGVYEGASHCYHPSGEGQVEFDWIGTTKKVGRGGFLGDPRQKGSVLAFTTLEECNLVDVRVVQVDFLGQ